MFKLIRWIQTSVDQVDIAPTPPADIVYTDQAFARELLLGQEPELCSVDSPGIDTELV
jgi:hypothetical protein